jgi:hypothetical protein
LNSYATTNACTLVVEPNSSYLSNTHSTSMVMPMSDPTMGLMLLLSTFQYQAPYMNPTYSNAASQAGKAAFVVSGGQAVQDRFVNSETEDGIDFAHSLGLTDVEMGIVGFTGKTIRSRQVNVRGPSIGPIRSSLTGTNNSGSIGLVWRFP